MQMKCNCRNKRDSRFFPGNKPAGILGITKKLLFFIENHVNGIGFQVFWALGGVDCEFWQCSCLNSLLQVADSGRQPELDDYGYVPEEVHEIFDLYDEQLL